MTAKAPTLDEMRAAAPHYGFVRDETWPEVRPPVIFRLRAWLWIHRRRGPAGICGYCARAQRRKTLVVNPIWHGRQYVELCARNRCLTRLRDWEAMGNARLARAQRDWELQNPDQVEYRLTPMMPAQYPSVSRAVLRAFLASGEDAATVEGSSVRAISGSIRRLGFAGRVYAEERSGQTVLRRVKT